MVAKPDVIEKLTKTGITSVLAVIWALPSETAEEDVRNGAGESYRKESPEESYRI